jgi:hypothetical protein
LSHKPVSLQGIIFRILILGVIFSMLVIGGMYLGWFAGHFLKKPLDMISTFTGAMIGFALGTLLLWWYATRPPKLAVR